MDTLHDVSDRLHADVPDYDDHNDFDSSIGRFGRMRKKFLQNFQKNFFSELSARGELQLHCSSVHLQARQKIDNLMQAMLRSDPPPDRNEFPMEWVNFMNTTKLIAESDVIRSFVLFFPDGDQDSPSADTLDALQQSNSIADVRDLAPEDDFSDDTELHSEIDNGDDYGKGRTEQEIYDFVTGGLEHQSLPENTNSNRTPDDFPEDI